MINENLSYKQCCCIYLDLGLDILDGVARLNLKGDGLTGQGLDEDLHLL